MSELRWLDGYSGETIDDLIRLEGTYRTDSLVLAFEQAISQKAAQNGEGALTPEELAILAIEALEQEVNNGGYEQFFENAGEYAAVIVDSLHRIGCPKTAEITQRAVEIASKRPEGDEQRSVALQECDDAYFERSESVEDSLFDFIKANRSKILV